MARVGVFLVTAALIAGMAGCSDPYADYIKIYNWTDLDNIRNNLVAKYVLMNDLDSTIAGYEELASPTANGGKGWEPIGSDLGTFNGTFNGLGYEIRGLFINRPDEYGVGLFGGVDEGGHIENVGVVDVTVTGELGVGGLAGGNTGTVTNSYATGSVIGNSRVGGLVGVNYYGSVTHSYSTGSVTGSSQVGGLVGYNTSTVSNSFWDRVTSGMEESDGGTGKTTAEMMDIAPFSGAGWDIITVANLGTRNPDYTWNIFDDETYPFLSWQSV